MFRLFSLIIVGTIVQREIRVKSEIFRLYERKARPNRTMVLVYKSLRGYRMRQTGGEEGGGEKEEEKKRKEETVSRKESDLEIGH